MAHSTADRFTDLTRDQIKLNNDYYCFYKSSHRERRVGHQSMRSQAVQPLSLYGLDAVPYWLESVNSLEAYALMDLHGSPDCEQASEF